MIEKILAGILIIGVLIREFISVQFDGLISIFGTLLAVMYLFANWWIDKPKEKNSRKVIASILYGIASASLTFSLVFKWLFLAGANELSLVSFVLALIAFAWDFLSSRTERKAMTTTTIWRLSSLSFLVIIYFFIPMDARINFTYRKHPQLLELYQTKKGSMEFYDLKSEYFKGAQLSDAVENQNRIKEYDKKILDTYQPFQIQLDSLFKIYMKVLLPHIKSNSFKISVRERTYLQDELNKCDSVARNTVIKLNEFEELSDDGFKKAVIKFTNRSNDLTKFYFGSILKILSDDSSVEKTKQSIREDLESFKNEEDKMITNLDSIRNEFLKKYNIIVPSD